MGGERRRVVVRVARGAVVNEDTIKRLKALCDRVDGCNEHGPGIWNDDDLADEWSDEVTTDVVRELCDLALRALEQRS